MPNENAGDLETGRRLGDIRARSQSERSSEELPSSRSLEHELSLLHHTGAFAVEMGGLASASVDAESASTAMLREALDSLVRLIERVAPGMRGSILLLDSDGVTLRHGAAPSLPNAYCRLIDGGQIGPEAGSCGTAAYRRQRVVVRDIATDPLWARYRAVAKPYGLAACWSTPIIDTDGDDGVLGTFAMYYDQPREPTDADIALTETATLLAKNVIKRARAAAALRARTEAAERLARALAESESRFREMAETIPVQVWTALPDGSLDFVTKRTAEFFGRNVKELLHTGWRNIVHPLDLERVSARWRHSIETGEPYEMQFRMLTRDGQYRWQLVRANPMRDADGRITQWFGCTADIEEHKQLEAALDAALADAKQANKAKSDFLAMMSHELRTPLNAVGGYAQLMLDGIPAAASEAHQNYLRRIVKSQQHLLGLIEAVLTHAKVEAGKVTYRITDVVACEVLEVVESLTTPLRQPKRLKYDEASCDQKLVFRADKEKLVQILLNIVSNAAKFTPVDGGITLSTGILSPAMASISVRDTGIGMSPEELRVVFEPYTQFDSSLSREHKGTGLGMPISRELARGMGGDLVATSEPGVGSTFTLSLPLAAPA
ncbi:MAG TPA: ATP-binding protein [Gemmatimonadaceae bacterium]|nr:ATP-binding protein [Gemmatimonadaceae bacterium]